MPVSITEVVGAGSATRTCAVRTYLFSSLSHKKGRCATPPPQPPPLNAASPNYSLSFKGTQA
jgi:hypothetical protein